MSAPLPSPRRFALAVGAATAATTVAVGVTAASLLGWFRPSGDAPVADPVPAAPAVAPAIEPPLAPEPYIEPQLAMSDGDHRWHDDDDHDDHDDHDDEDDEDDEGDDDHDD